MFARLNVRMLAALLFIFTLMVYLVSKTSWLPNDAAGFIATHRLPPEGDGLGLRQPPPQKPQLTTEQQVAALLEKPAALLQQETTAKGQDGGRIERQKFKAGIPYPLNHEYSMTVVVGKRKVDDTEWLDLELPSSIKNAVYVVDDPDAPLHPPQNKGNEVMVYLTYIIDHYEELSDISIFMHHHRWAWHNNDLLHNDAVTTLNHLLPQRIIREGYVNLRCQWDPGCPTWLNPSSTQISEDKLEEPYVKEIWGALFPSDPLPSNLAQTCCSQFALSRDRIHAIPQAEYERIRTWVLTTSMPDHLSGRVFEYLWQHLFAGQAVLCPSQHACYCDLYGICFEDEATFQHWFELRFYLRRDEDEVLRWEAAAAAREELARKGKSAKAEEVEIAPLKRLEGLRKRIDQRWIRLIDMREQAIARGKDGVARALVANRAVDWGDVDPDIVGEGNGQGREEAVAGSS